MANYNNDGLDVFITRKYTLSERVLTLKVEELEQKYGFDIVCVETENGYVFKDKNFGVSIADLTFNKTFGEYNRINIYSAAIEDVYNKFQRQEELERAQRARANKEQRAKARRRKFALQAGALGVALTIGGTIALMGFGVIDTPSHPHQPTETAGVVVQAEALNTLTSCNDVILIEWLNYAMGQVQESCSDSPYEYFDTLSQDIYVNEFAPAMSAYYNYLDYKDSGLPLSSEYGDRDLVGESHEKFRNLAYQFASYLKNSTYFSKLTFDNSPLVNAVVTDKEGNVLQESTSIKGELITEDGKPVSAIDNESVVNIKLADIESPYTMDNLPEDVKIINGEIYVSSKHMYQDYGSKSK